MIIGNAIYLGGTPLPEITNPAVAGDIRYGKQSIDGDGEVLTGTIPDYEGETDTGMVIPVDTGANGQCRQIIEGIATEYIDPDLTKTRGYGLGNNKRLHTVRLPNWETSAGGRPFSSDTALTGILYFPKLSQADALFENALNKTCIITVLSDGGRMLASSCAQHVKVTILDGVIRGGQAFVSGNYIRTLDLNGITRIITTRNIAASTSLRHWIFRSAEGIVLSSAIFSANEQFYMPKSLVNSYYSTATNWTTYYNNGQIIGIDEDTTATVGTLFTPTASATVDHWDQVDLQSYSVGTVDTTDGSITPTHDGRLLIRGLDANDEIVHVTYLQIGTGFDEEANLAD